MVHTHAHTCRTESEESVGGEGETRCFPRDLMDNRDELSSSSSNTSHDDGTRGKRSRCVSASDDKGITYVRSPQVCINWRLQPTCSFRCSYVRKRVLRTGSLRTFTTAHREWSYIISAK